MSDPLAALLHPTVCDSGDRYAYHPFCETFADRLRDVGVTTAAPALPVGAETWRCPGCRDTTAPEGMCQRCGVFGEMETLAAPAAPAEGLPEVPASEWYRQGYEAGKKAAAPAEGPDVERLAEFYHATRIDDCVHLGGETTPECVCFAREYAALEANHE